MIIRTTGNLLEADVQALVNPINCVGVMGKGLALQFRRAFPTNYEAYRLACSTGQVVLGQMFVFATGRLTNPLYVINFPTKQHWREPSYSKDIFAGLVVLRAEVEQRGITSIAIPPLGCGNGGLRWPDIRPLIEQALAGLPEVHVLLYEPYNRE